VVVVEEKAVDKEIAKELRECGIELIRPVRPTRLEGHSGEFSLIVERNAAKKQVSPDRRTRDKDPCYQKISAGLVILGRDEFNNIPYQRDPFAREFHIGKKKAFGTLETGIPGVYMASWSQARKIPRETSGKAAAGKALEGIFQRADRPDYLVAHVDRELCRGCGRCADICPEGAAWLKEAARGAASSWIEPGLCGGCGNCMAECPTGAITMPESEQGYFEKVIDVFLG
jgi:ferredoxin